MSSQSLRTSLQIVRALLARDLRALQSRILNKIIDGGIVMLTSVLMFGHLYPTLGMSPALIGATYLGAIASFILFVAYSQSIGLAFDIRFKRFIDYQLTLPISKQWLFAEYILFNSIELLAITLPLATIGVTLLRHHFSFSALNLLLFFAAYLWMLLFYSLFFMALTLYYQFDFFLNNIWPRRLTLLFCISANFVPYKAAAKLSPFFGYLLLLNPITYIIEGLRAALIGGPDYLPLWACASGSLIFIILAALALRIGIYKRLDPV